MDDLAVWRSMHRQQHLASRAAVSRRSARPDGFHQRTVVRKICGYRLAGRAAEGEQPPDNLSLEGTAKFAMDCTAAATTDRGSIWGISRSARQRKHGVEGVIRDGHFGGFTKAGIGPSRGPFDQSMLQVSTTQCSKAAAWPADLMP